MKNEKKNLPKRSYDEVMADFQKARTPKEYRKVHKIMKRYYKESVPIWYRYPNLPIHLCVVALIIAAIKSLFKN